MEASPSPSVTESKAGFDEKEMTSLRNRFWPSSSLISIYTIFPQQPPQSMLHVSGDWKGLEKTLCQDMAPLLAYLRIWKLKLCHAKTVTVVFHLRIRETQRELKVYANGKFCHFPSANLPRGKTGQITHVSPPPRDIAQKTINLRQAAKTTCGLGMGC